MLLVLINIDISNFEYVVYKLIFAAAVKFRSFLASLLMAHLSPELRGKIQLPDEGHSQRKISARLV